MRLPKIKRKVLLSWLVSYLFILFCSLLTGIMIYSSATNVLSREIQGVSRASLENIKTLLDGKLRELEAASSILEMDTDIRTVVQSQLPLDSADTVLAFRRCKDLFTRTMAYNSYISDIYLYSPKSRVILSSRYGLNEEKMAKFPTEDTFGISWEEFYGLLVRKPSYKYVILPFVKGEEFEQILFFYPILQNSVGNDGIIVFQVDTEKLLKLVKGTDKFTNAGLVIIDSKGQKIFAVKNNFNIQVLSYNELGSEPFQYKYNGKTTMIYSTQSNVNSWKYVLIYDMDRYLGSIYHLRNMTIIFLIGLSLFGIAISVILAKHNYSPIERIIHNISHLSPGYGSVGANELQYLEKTFNTLFHEKESFSERLKRQRDVILNSLMVQLLKGRISSPEKVQEVLSAEPANFKTDKFIVVAMVIEDFGKLLPDDNDSDNGNPDINRAAELAYVVVKNVLEEMLGEEYKSIVVEIDTMIACVINVKGEDEGIVAYVTEILERALKLIRTHFELLIFASVSNIHNSLLGISKCYQEAQETLDKALLFDKGRIITRYCDISNSCKSGQQGYLRLEKRNIFLNNLLVENYANAERLAMEFIDFDQRGSTGNTGIKEFRIRKYSIIDDLNCALEMLKTDDKNALWQEANNVMLKMVNSRNISEFRLLVQKLFSLFQQIHKEKEGYLKDDDKVQEIIHYIDSNLTDPNLSVAMISEHAGLSVSHVTRLMRNKVGLGTLEYIQKKRIDAAKKLLKETDISIDEIARKVGYYSFRTMNYVFKRLEGITGAQYRKKARNGLINR